VPSNHTTPRGDGWEMEALERSVMALSAAHQHRDPFTVWHQRRTAELSVEIAKELGLEARNIAVLGLAASVHDIGKIAVPAEILYRTEALSDGEYAVIKTHSTIGQDILQRLKSPFAVAEIIAQHHERLDGSGYPNGLRGEDISIEARILAVADVFDAMISKRPYRDGLPREFVFNHLQEEAGRLLDADAVAACCQCILRREAAVAAGTSNPSTRGAPN
jgi:putative nucleotidyltransferase with HDIG domain